MTVDLSAWQYLKSRTITGTSSTLTDYQECFKVYKNGPDGNENIGLLTAGKINCNGHCQDNFNDLRFTDENSNSLLPYWIQSKEDGNYAIVWVKVNSIPANTNTIIWMYYGNPSATPGTNGADTFPVFADFVNGIDDGWTWTNQPSSPASSSTSDSKLTISSGGQNVDVWQYTDTGYQLKTNCPSATGFEAIVKMPTSNPSTTYHTWGIIAKQNSTNWVSLYNQYSNVIDLCPNDNGSSSSTALTINGYANLLALRSLNNIWTGKYTNDPNSWNDGYSYSVNKSLTNPTIGLLVKTATTTPFYASFDWIFTRKLVNPEPTHTNWGGEQPNGSGTFVVLSNARYSGDGSKQTTRSYRGSNVIMQLDSNSTDLNSNGIIENLIIDGEGGGDTTIGLQLQNVANCIIRNVTIMNCNIGINLLTVGAHSMRGNRFEHIRMKNVKYGIVFNGTTTDKDFSYTTLDDVQISLKEGGYCPDATGILVGTDAINTANLDNAFIKATVWLGVSEGKAMEVKGRVKYSLVNLEVEQDPISPYPNLVLRNGKGLQVDQGAYVTDNQSFYLATAGIKSNPEYRNYSPVNATDSTLTVVSI